MVTVTLQYLLYVKQQTKTHFHIKRGNFMKTLVDAFNEKIDILLKENTSLKEQLVQEQIKNEKSLDSLIQLKIFQTKLKLQDHLINNPLQFTDGKFYSVTAEKQNLLNNAITVYQMKVQAGIPATLKWNATGEECTEWTVEDLSALALAIAEYVEPLVTHQQALEVQIRNCETLEELEAIEIDYESI